MIGPSVVFADGCTATEAPPNNYILNCEEPAERSGRLLVARAKSKPKPQTPADVEVGQEHLTLRLERLAKSLGLRKRQSRSDARAV